ncbi:unnamed protein product [Linum tenue]|uniref:Flavin-containing monooxygenase n=1 Tax=Linum tenue TaxID=586396 RepID=A0AAV0JXH8_9ROSI|nr:unnamed protein product [Linum tenue]
MAEPSQAPSPPIPRRVNAAVIGAGPAGLVAARELRREGHSVTVFEKGSQIGGTWVYTPEFESDDPLGIDPTRPVVHSSMYESLRTNLPREVMGFMDYPFVAGGGGGGGVDADGRRFPGHREVLRYLEEFAREFGIGEGIVRLEREVVNVAPVEDGSGRSWKVTSVNSNNKEAVEEMEEEVFDAVVVCNGHHSQPRIADFPGVKSWPGKQIHSHNYRTPQPFKDQVVVLIGHAPSGADLSINIAGVAKQVHVASTTVVDPNNNNINYPSQSHPTFPNIWIHPMVEKACGDGSVVFRDGVTVFPDIIIHCTGYTFHFPFIRTAGIVTVEDSSVRPLYKHVFPPAWAPGISFVGLPHRTLLFPLFELQSKWISGVLSGRISLPSEEEMMRDANDFYSAIQAAGVPTRHTHNMLATAALEGDDYSDWVAAQCQCRGVESWRRGMFLASRSNGQARPETFRDEWEDGELVIEAHRYFASLKP